MSGRRGGKPLLRRSRADEDVQGAIDHLVADSPAVALKFVDALEATCVRIRRSPAIGSLRYADELGLPGLRCRLCGRSPYLVFYMEYADRIEVWRVLQMRRDVPRRFAESD